MNNSWVDTTVSISCQAVTLQFLLQTPGALNMKKSTRFFILMASLIMQVRFRNMSNCETRQKQSFVNVQKVNHIQDCQIYIQSHNINEKVHSMHRNSTKSSGRSSNFSVFTTQYSSLLSTTFSDLYPVLPDVVFCFTYPQCLICVLSGRLSLNSNQARG